MLARLDDFCLHLVGFHRPMHNFGLHHIHYVLWCKDYCHADTYLAIHFTCDDFILRIFCSLHVVTSPVHAVMKKGELYNKMSKGLTMYFSTNCDLHITVRADTTLAELQRHLELTVGVPAEKQQISVEGRHYYSVKNDVLGKLFMAEIEKLLKDPVIDRGKLEYFSNELRAAYGDRLPKRLQKMYTDKQRELHEKLQTVRTPRSTSSPRLRSAPEWRQSDIDALHFCKTQLEAKSGQHETENDVEEEDGADIQLRTLFDDFGRQSNYKTPNSYFKLHVSVRDGDISLSRGKMTNQMEQDLDTEYIQKYSRSTAAPGILQTVRQDGDAASSDVSRKEQKDSLQHCIEMLRGLAEILEEERQVRQFSIFLSTYSTNSLNFRVYFVPQINAGLVPTIEDVRCRLQLTRGLTVRQRLPLVDVWRLPL